MSKIITRRDILKFTGGGILGVMFSPLPWKLLDDSAIWTQNWSLIPKLSHGPISTTFSHCMLCGGGCAIKAQCVSGMPYYVSGIQNHPITRGKICTRGLASHHMAHHPLRIVHPHKFVGKSDNSRMIAISLEDSLNEVSKQIKNSKGTITILDQQPTRAISEIYQQFLDQCENGMFLTSPSREDATLIALQEMMNRSEESFGFDFENTNMILSFGAPLLDNWGTPGRMTSLRNDKKVKFIQIESRNSRTAQQSDQWIAINPGTEKTFALNLAYVLIHENIYQNNIRSIAKDFSSFKNIVEKFNPNNTHQITGIEPNIIRTIAHELIHANAAIVLSGADPGGGPFDHETEKIVASLNLLIGNIGKSGGIISRNNIPGYKRTNISQRWSDIPDQSIGVLIVDGADSGYALPWSLIERKLILNEGIVVSLSPTLNEISAHSDFLIPSPALFESTSDVPNSHDHHCASFALSAPLLKKQDNTTEPIDVMKGLVSRLNLTINIPAQEELLKQKVEKIHKANRGTIFTYADQRIINISEILSADELWTKFIEGAIWIDQPSKQTTVKRITFALAPVLPNEEKNSGMPMIAHGWRGATSTSQISPILSKVFQETELRNNNGTVSVNPTTAEQLALTKDDKAILSTKNGSMKVRVKIDNSIRQGIIEVSIAPHQNGIETPTNLRRNNILNLCEVTDEGTWKITTANLVKV